MSMDSIKVRRLPHTKKRNIPLLEVCAIYVFVGVSIYAFKRIDCPYCFPHLCFVTFFYAEFLGHFNLFYAEEVVLSTLGQRIESLPLDQDP